MAGKTFSSDLDQLLTKGISFPCITGYKHVKSDNVEVLAANPITGKINSIGSYHISFALVFEDADNETYMKVLNEFIQAVNSYMMGNRKEKPLLLPNAQIRNKFHVR